MITGSLGARIAESRSRFSLWHAHKSVFSLVAFTSLLSAAVIVNAAPLPATVDSVKLEGNGCRGEIPWRIEADRLSFESPDVQVESKGQDEASATCKVSGRMTTPRGYKVRPVLVRYAGTTTLSNARSGEVSSTVQFHGSPIAVGTLKLSNGDRTFSYSKNARQVLADSCNFPVTSSFSGETKITAKGPQGQGSVRDIRYEIRFDIQPCKK